MHRIFWCMRKCSGALRFYNSTWINARLWWSSQLKVRKRWCWSRRIFRYRLTRLLLHRHQTTCLYVAPIVSSIVWCSFPNLFVSLWSVTLNNETGNNYFRKDIHLRNHVLTQLLPYYPRCIRVTLYQHQSGHRSFEISVFRRSVNLPKSMTMKDASCSNY